MGQFRAYRSPSSFDRTRLFAIAGGSVLLLLFAGALVILLHDRPANDSGASRLVVEREQPVELGDVLVAYRDIEPGTPLEPSLFRNDRRPRTFISEKMVRSLEEIKGQFARYAIPKDEPFYSINLTKEKPTSALASGIPDGYRAVSIKVDATIGIEGWARPGAFVDVSCIVPKGSSKLIRQIVNGAKVLSADGKTEQNPQNKAEIPSTMTIQTSVEDSAKVQLCSNAGSITLALRGTGDPVNATQPIEIDLDKLLKGDAGIPAASCQGKVRLCSSQDTCADFCMGEGGKLLPKRD